MKLTVKILLAVLLPTLFLSRLFIPGFSSEPVSFPTPETLPVSVEPLPLRVYCPGAFAEIGGESGVELGAIERIGEASIYLNTGDGELLADPGLRASEGALAKITGSDQSTNLLSAIQAQGVVRERASGMMASYCPQPSFSGWFISGAASVGYESALLVANPNDQEVQMEIIITFPDGQVSDQLTLAAQENRVVPLSSLVFQQPIFTLSFQTSGQPISVAMQQRATFGLSTRGVDLQSPVAQPTTDSLITGLSVGSAGFEPAVARLYNPGQIPTEVVITAISGQSTQVVRAQLAAGELSELELDLIDGEYLVQVQSAQPILVGIRNPVIQPTIDFSWLTASELFTDLTLPIPDYRSTLYLANPGASPITLNLQVTTGDRQQYQSFEIPALAQISVPVSGDSLRLSSASEFAASLEILDVPGYAVIRPTENQNFGDELLVSVR